MSLDLPRNLVVDHSPSKSARTKGPVVGLLPAELVWEWLRPSESDSVLCPDRQKCCDAYSLRDSMRTSFEEGFLHCRTLGVEQRECTKTSSRIPSLLTTLFLHPEVTTGYQRPQRKVEGFIPYLRWLSQFSCSCKSKQHISKFCQCNHKYLEEND